MSTRTDQILSHQLAVGTGGVDGRLEGRVKGTDLARHGLAFDGCLDRTATAVPQHHEDFYGA
ncbi:putative metal-binding protein [Mesorhizobium soli]|nr:putative metal-binding protein [Mesorhizobium soli]